MRSARTPLAVALLLPWAAWALVRTLGLDGGHPLVSAMAFTPYATATAWLPVVGALLLRRRILAGVALVPAVLLVVAVAPRALGDGRVPASADGPTLRIMSVNVYEGRGDARRIMRLARRFDVDVLSLQELTPDAVRRLDAAGARERFPGRALAPRPGAAGSGLMARRRLRDRSPDDATEAEQPEAELRLPGAMPVRIKAVHPRPPISGISEPDWQASLDRLPRPGARPRGPLRILAGDFNGTLDHRAVRRLLGDGYLDAADATGRGLVRTWPRGRPEPPITIDHVLLDRRLGVRSLSVHDVAGTDHRAVVAELVLPAQ